MKKRRDLSDKPYYECLNCPIFRKECGGIPTRDMTIQELCEMVRDTIDFLDLDIEEIAVDADASVKTIEKMHAVSIDKDMLRGTTRRVEIAVFGHSSKFMCCNLGKDKKIIMLEEEVSALKDKLAATEKDKQMYAKIISKFIDNDAERV